MILWAERQGKQPGCHSLAGPQVLVVEVMEGGMVCLEFIYLCNA